MLRSENIFIHKFSIYEKQNIVHRDNLIALRPRESKSHEYGNFNRGMIKNFTE